MKDLTVINRLIKDNDPQLEHCLLELSLFGKPRLGVFNDQMLWNCSIEMFVTGQGICFEVKSDFTHKTPLSAVKECMSRVYNALKDLETK